MLLIVMISWLTLPACSFSSVCRRIYPTVSVIQLLGLSGLLFLQIAFPRQMEQLGWATHRTLGSVITSSVNQKEITSEWSTLQWFNNVGEPQVWYSGSAVTGYKLWATPGFDPNSGKELLPVKDEKTRTQITIVLSEKARTIRERAAAEQTDIARKEDEGRRIEQDRLAREREASAKGAEELVAEKARRDTEQAKRDAEQRRAQKQARYMNGHN